MTVKLLTEHHLEFLGLTGSCTGLSESTLVKMPHCWKSHVGAQLSHATYCHVVSMSLPCGAVGWLGALPGHTHEKKCCRNSCTFCVIL